MKKIFVVSVFGCRDVDFYSIVHSIWRYHESFYVCLQYIVNRIHHDTRN